MSATPAALRLRRSLPRPRLATGRLSTLASGLVAFLLLRPLLGLTHELLVFGLAGLLRSISDQPLWQAVIGRLPCDPVYTLALIQFAGEIRAGGVAVGGPLGAALHAALPGLFAGPELVVGGWASAVIEPGATVLARGLAGFGADLGLLTVGLACFLAGRRGRPWLAVLGVLQQAHIVLYHFLDSPLSPRELEAAGLPFAVSSLASNPSQRAPWFTSEMAQMPEPVVSAASGLLLTGLAYLLAGAALGGPPLIWRVARRLRGGPGHSLGFRPAIPRLSQVALGLGLLGLALTPLGAFAEAETRVLDGAGLVRPAAYPLPPAALSAAGAAGPRSVQFVGRRYHYALLVDGVPQVVHGMGYNVQYASLGPDERARRYERDFSELRASGVNVIFGWFQDQFDGQTLATAGRFGLGVAMPYELNQDLDYADPAVRARITADVLSWVARYKDDPAVWFWTPGNEVIHRLIFPSWLKHEANPVGEARADSFARFYVELIDRIHALDPSHPIIYRDAEDPYLWRIRDALLRDGVARPWFGYGTNVYTRRLDEILRNWPNQGLDAPLLVSEFAPGGTGPVDRPVGFRAMWATIRSYPDWVIGGAAYAWSTDGPEELDRVFGLVDGNGRPRDDALTTVAELYREDQQAGR